MGLRNPPVNDPVSNGDWPRAEHLVLMWAGPWESVIRNAAARTRSKLGSQLGTVMGFAFSAEVAPPVEEHPLVLVRLADGDIPPLRERKRLLEEGIRIVPVSGRHAHLCEPTNELVAEVRARLSDMRVHENRINERARRGPPGASRQSAASTNSEKDEEANSSLDDKQMAAFIRQFYKGRDS